MSAGCGNVSWARSRWPAGRGSSSPTSPRPNLDVTIQGQYLICSRTSTGDGVALIFVTHNLGIVAKMCDRSP